MGGQDRVCRIDGLLEGCSEGGMVEVTGGRRGGTEVIASRRLKGARAPRAQVTAGHQSLAWDDTLVPGMGSWAFRPYTFS